MWGPAEHAHQRSTWEGVYLDPGSVDRMESEFWEQNMDVEHTFYVQYNVCSQQLRMCWKPMIIIHFNAIVCQMFSDLEYFLQSLFGHCDKNQTSPLQPRNLMWLQKYACLPNFLRHTYIPQTIFIREALKKITILLLTFVRKGGVFWSVLLQYKKPQSKCLKIA